MLIFLINELSILSVKKRKDKTIYWPLLLASRMIIIFDDHICYSHIVLVNDLELIYNIFVCCNCFRLRIWGMKNQRET
jgi:hypothetical protein